MDFIEDTSNIPENIRCGELIAECSDDLSFCGSALHNVKKMPVVDKEMILKGTVLDWTLSG